MIKPEQRPNVDDTREPENASPRRVPLNAMLGWPCYENCFRTNTPKKKSPSLTLGLVLLTHETHQGKKGKHYLTPP